MIQIFLFIIALLGQYAQCNSAEVIVYTIENKLESDFSCQCDLKITPSEGWKLAMPPDVDYSNSSDPATMSVETVSFDNHSCHLRVNSSRASASDYRRFSLKVTCSACSDMCRIIPLNIDVEFNCEVTEIHRDKKFIKLKNEKTINYDKLVLALGAQPALINFENSKNSPLFSLRTLADADKIKEFING